MLTLKGVDKLSRKLNDMGKLSFSRVTEDNVKQMFTRAKSLTPRDSGELLASCGIEKSMGEGFELVYTARHSAPVEYGHRTAGGKFVPGQYFLKQNIDLQREKYRQDLVDKMKRGE